MDRRVVEYPIELSEKRPPSIGLMRRVPKVLSDMGKLAVTVRRNK